MASGALAAEYASQVFRRLLERSQERLSRGAQLRAAMAAQIAAGITPTGYRAEFLHESSTKVIALLGTLAEQFNAEQLFALYEQKGSPQKSPQSATN